MNHTEHWYMLKWPAYNKSCCECGREFNALYVKPRNRVTCSKECSKVHTVKIQRENTARYVRTPEYKARNRIRNKVYRADHQVMVMVMEENLK